MNRRACTGLALAAKLPPRLPLLLRKCGGYENLCKLYRRDRDYDEDDDSLRTATRLPRVYATARTLRTGNAVPQAPMWSVCVVSVTSGPAAKGERDSKRKRGKDDELHGGLQSGVGSF
jgi:hypothetical protein